MRTIRGCRSSLAQDQAAAGPPTAGLLRRVARILALSMAVLLLLPAPALATSGKTAHHRTTIRWFRPFLSSGAIAPGYHVVGRRRAHSSAGLQCFGPSYATFSRDAFRCYSGDLTYDPCFRDPAGALVACPVAMFPKRVVLLSVTKPLVRGPAWSGDHHAWLLVLPSHVACRWSSGASMVWHGLRLNFSCSNHLGLYGHAQSQHQPWTIRTCPEGQFCQHMKRVRVAAAWF